MSTPTGHARTGAREGESFRIRFEARELEAWPGETVAAVLLAAGIIDFRDSADGTGRGLLCGIGVCWECRCVIDGRPNTRACMTEARPGMTVLRQESPA